MARYRDLDTGQVVDERPARYRIISGPVASRRRRPAPATAGGLTVAELREACREAGLPVSGNKAELTARLEAHDG